MLFLSQVKTDVENVTSVRCFETKLTVSILLFLDSISEEFHNFATDTLQQTETPALASKILINFTIISIFWPLLFRGQPNTSQQKQNLVDPTSCSISAVNITVPNVTKRLVSTLHNLKYHTIKASSASLHLSYSLPFFSLYLWDSKGNSNKELWLLFLQCLLLFCSSSPSSLVSL